VNRHDGVIHSSAPRYAVALSTFTPIPLLSSNVTVTVMSASLKACTLDVTLLQVCYPKRTDKPLYHGLVTQCESLGIPFLSLEELEQQCSTAQPQQQQQQPQGPAASGARGGSGLSAVCDVVIDALFGFSFKGTPRPPFDKLLAVSSEVDGGQLGLSLSLTIACCPVGSCRACAALTC